MGTVIPETGIHGAALREAATTEMRQIMELVRSALAKKIAPDRPDLWVCVEAVYPDRVIVAKDGRYWSYPYALADDNTVVLGDPQEVIEQYVPVAMREAAAFIEATGEADGTGEKKNILVRIIRAGLSKNNFFYPDAVLRESAPRFEGARVFVKSDPEHIQGGGKSFEKLAGKITDVRFVAGYAPDHGELRGVFRPIEPDGAVATKLREAVQNKMADLFGLSIDADGAATQPRDRARPRVAQSITKVNSVDIIVEPGAGGEFIRLTEAVHPQSHSEDAMRQRMIEAVKAKHGGALPAGLNVEDDTALEAAYREAVAPAPQPQAGADIDERLRMIEARGQARTTIAASTLPQPAKDRLLADFAARARFVEADVAAAIEGERAYLARFTEAGHVVGLGEGRIESGQDRADKLAKMLDDFFNAKGVHSFKECYVEITGDRRATGHLRDCDPVRLREAAGMVPAQFREAAMNSATFSLILGDGIHRRMIADYRQPTQYDIWRPLVGTPVPITDFRTNERTRFGGFGDLPIVAELGNYQDMAAPSEEEATYTIAKRGGIFQITMEMIRNDDVGLIRRLPTSATRAAKRTLAKFVLDFIRANPAIYDGKALFHADHGNLGTSALSATSFAAARLAMLKQAELDTREPLGIAPKYLWVAYDREQDAVDLFKRDTNLDETFVQSLKPTIVPVWYWTDANDWAATADPLDCPFLELGFLDGNEEPELFVQDSPTVGSLFNNDTITYKIRHIYGGNALDYRGAYKAVVP